MPTPVEIAIRTSGQGQTAAAFAQTDRALAGLKGTATATTQALSMFAGQVLYRATAMLANLGRQGLATAEAMREGAEKTGMSAKGYQQLAYAASMTGSSMGVVDSALRILQVNIAEGDKSLARMGLSFGQLQSMSPDRQFYAVAEAISKIPTQARRTQAAVQAFGRSGAELVPMINSLRTLSDEATRLGIVLDTKALAAAERFNETLVKLRLQAQSKIVLAVEFLTDKENTASVAGMGMGAAGGAALGGVFGGAKGIKYGAAAGAAVTAYGQKKVSDLANLAGFGLLSEDEQREADARDKSAQAKAEKEQAETNKRTSRMNAAAAAVAKHAAENRKAKEEQGKAQLAAYAWVDEQDQAAKVGGNTPDAEAQRNRMARVKSAGMQGWFKAGQGDVLKGAQNLLAGMTEDDRDAQEVMDKETRIKEEIGDTEKRLADALRTERDDLARQEIDDERRRMDRRLQELEKNATSLRTAATRSAAQANDLRASVLPQTAESKAQAEADAAEQATNRRLDRQIASARRREAELANLYGSDARSRMTRKGQQLLAYDDSRQEARGADRAADTAERQARRQREQNEARSFVLQEQELAMQRNQIQASSDLTAELAKLRNQLAGISKPQPTTRNDNPPDAEPEDKPAPRPRQPPGTPSMPDDAKEPPRPSYSQRRAIRARPRPIGSGGNRIGDIGIGSLGGNGIGSLEGNRMSIGDLPGNARGAGGGEEATLSELRNHTRILHKIAASGGIV